MMTFLALFRQKWTSGFGIWCALTKHLVQKNVKATTFSNHCFKYKRNMVKRSIFFFCKKTTQCIILLWFFRLWWNIFGRSCHFIIFGWNGNDCNRIVVCFVRIGSKSTMSKKTLQRNYEHNCKIQWEYNTWRSTRNDLSRWSHFWSDTNTPAGTLDSKSMHTTISIAKDHWTNQANFNWCGHHGCHSHTGHSNVRTIDLYWTNFIRIIFFKNIFKFSWTNS